MDNVQGLLCKLGDGSIRPMAVDFDQVEVRQAIDQSAGRDISNAFEVIAINGINIAAFELDGAARNGIEHLGSVQVVNRTEHEIQLVPILFYPFAARGGVNRIVIEFNSRADFQVVVIFAQPLDLIEHDALVIPIVIGESDIGQTELPGV